MKKTFKITALLLAITLLAVSLCSCQALDEARTNHAVFTDKEYTAIEFKGHTYRLMDSSEKYDFIIANYYTDCYVTDKDVPVLLKGMFGQPISFNGNETVIEVDIDSAKATADEVFFDSYDMMNYNPHMTYNTNYYVREDVYDAVKASIKNAKLDHYYIEFYPYEFGTHESHEQQILIDDELTEIVNNILKAPNDNRIAFESFNPRHADYQYISLYVCDKDMVLTKRNLDYRLILLNNDVYFWPGTVSNPQKNGFYRLNKEDALLVKELMQRYPDALMYDNQFYGYENDNGVYYDEDPNNGAVVGNGDSSVAAF